MSIEKLEAQLIKARGNKVLGFTFTFSPEEKNEDDFTQGHKLSKNKIKNRKEKLPEWAKDGYKDTDPYVDDKTQRELKRRLKEYEENKKKHLAK